MPKKIEFTKAVIEFNNDKISYEKLLGAYRDILGLNPLINIRDFDLHKIMNEKLRDLPIWNHMDKIVKFIRKNTFLILKAGTGSGKSTQLPPQLLTKDILFGDEIIYCTQPRVANAKGICEGVNKRMFGFYETPYISYQTGSGSNVNKKSSLIYLTEAIMKFKIKDILEEVDEKIVKKKLKNIYCILVDEIHERSKDVDFLLYYLNELHKRCKKSKILSGSFPKIVIMSATFNPLQFTSYFNVGLDNIYEVEGAVSVINDIYMPDDFEIKIDVILQKTLETLTSIINVDSEKIGGDIIIFVSGTGDAKWLEENIIKSYQDNKFSVSKDLQIVVLNRKTINTEEVQEIISKPINKNKYSNKILIGTNVAETGITLPHLTHVIDTMMENIAIYDFDDNYISIQKNIICKNSALQRRGRVGRVREGYYYPIISKKDFDNLVDFNEPSIITTDCDLEVLELLNNGSKIQNIDKVNLPTKILPNTVLNCLHLFNRMSFISENSFTTIYGNFRIIFPKLQIHYIYYMIQSFKNDTIYECLKILSYHFAMPEKLTSYNNIQKKKHMLFEKPKNKIDKEMKTNFKAKSQEIFDELIEKCLQNNIPIKSNSYTKNIESFKKSAQFIFYFDNVKKLYVLKSNPLITLNPKQLRIPVFENKLLYCLLIVKIDRNFINGLYLLD